MKRARESGFWGFVEGTAGFVINTVTSIFAPEFLQEMNTKEHHGGPEKRFHAANDPVVVVDASFADFSPIRSPRVVERVEESPRVPERSSQRQQQQLSFLDLVEGDEEMTKFETSVLNLSVSTSRADLDEDSFVKVVSPRSQRRTEVPHIAPLDRFYKEALERSRVNLVEVADPPDRETALNRLRILSQKLNDSFGAVKEMEDHLDWARQNAEDTEDISTVAKLTDEEEALYQKAVGKGKEDDVVSSPFVSSTYDTDIRRRDVWRMKPGEWLNDECINLFMKIIQRRADTNKAMPQVHCFNTFFYELLTTGGFVKVQRWTRRADLFSKDMVLIPVHLGNHWCLAIINFKQKRLEYYDSLRGGNPECMEALRKYIQDEHQDKKKKPFSFDGWKADIINDKKLPLQKNGYDCGVFACMFAECFARNEFPRFSQDDLPLLRKRMVVSLITGQI